MVAFFVVGVYRGVWRHFGMMDTLVVARGVFVGAVAALLVILYVYRFFAYSRTVFAIYARAAADRGDAVARVVPAGRRVHAAPAADRAAASSSTAPATAPVW